MKHKALFVCGILLAAGVALALRLPALAARPMHTDEAVHTVRCDHLRHGTYHYDPNEYHGASLYYGTLPVMWLTGAKTFARTAEWTYRIVPVIFGTLLVLMLLACGDALGAPGAVAAAVLTAVSAAMVFYSRYYIQEMLLVTFTFGLLIAAWRYVRTGRVVWALAAGACVGLMHATKETCILVWAVGGAAAVCARLWRKAPRAPGGGVRRKWWHGGAALAAAAVVSVAVFSQFGRDWTGPVDSVRAFTDYFHRGSGGEGRHVHPWDFYFRILLAGDGSRWQAGESLIVVLAVIGVAAALAGRLLGRANVWAARWLAMYTVGMAAIYAAIPYKTPWCMLGFLHGAILLAGLGAVALILAVRKRRAQIAVAAVLLVAAGQLAWVAYRDAYPECAAPANPYVYGHSARGVVELARKVEAAAAWFPDEEVVVKIAATGEDYWPLPWYLRALDGRVGYWSGVPTDRRGRPAADAPIIVCSPDLVDPLVRRLKQKYTLETYEVRPQVELMLWIRTPTQFHHRSMGSPLTFAIAGQDPAYAAEIAVEVKDLVDRLNSRLSHYVATSDVSQIQALTAGQTVRVAPETFECLRQAKIVHDETGGAFDPTIGALLACWRTDEKEERTPTDAELAAARKRTGVDLLELNEADLSVRVKADHIRVDLGGIGKGYAVDRMVELLREWGVRSAVVNFGHSSVYGLGAPRDADGWPCTLYDPDDWAKPVAKIRLRDRAFGASGTSLQGRHIIDPRTGRPVSHRHATWALAPTAAQADALSTAFMMMTVQEVEQYCRTHPDVSALLLQRDGRKRTMHRFGKW